MNQRAVKARLRDLLSKGALDLVIGCVLIVSFVAMGLTWQAMLNYSIVNPPVLFSARSR